MNDSLTLQKVVALLEDTIETLCLPRNHEDTVWFDRNTPMVDQLNYILGVAKNMQVQLDVQVPMYLPGEAWAISKVLDNEVPAVSPDWMIWRNIAELVPITEVPRSVHKVACMDGVDRVTPSVVRVQVGWFLLTFDQNPYLFQVSLSSAFAEDYVANTALLGWIADAPLLCGKQLLGSVEAYDEMRCFMERYNKTLGVSVTLLPEVAGLYNDLVLPHVL